LVLAYWRIGVTAVAFRDRSLAAGASDKPVETALKALIDRGPEGNPYLIISDFDAGDNMVVDEKGGKWDKVWVPIVPFVRSGKTSSAQSVKALMYSFKIKNQDDLAKVIQKDKIQGMVINKIQGLDSSTRNLLQKSYPKSDVEKIIIFELDREPAGSAGFFIKVLIALAPLTAVAVLVWLGIKSP